MPIIVLIEGPEVILIRLTLKLSVESLDYQL